MIWKNKGYELEEFRKIFEGKRIFIYGAGVFGKDLFERLSGADCVEGFIDRDTLKQQEGFCRKEVLSIYDFMEKDSTDIIVVTASVNPTTTCYFKNQLLRCGYREGVNLFEGAIFKDFYMPIYMWYAHNKIYMKTVSVLTTSVCNLNCRGCLNFTYANNNKRHHDFNVLTRDIDYLFSYVDYVYWIWITGGESLLYPQLGEIIKYINTKYSGRFHHLVIPTNGTIIPDEEVCEICRNVPIVFQIDDYRKNVKKCHDTIPKLIKKLERYGISYEVNYVEKWFELKRDKIEETDENLQKKFLACCMPFPYVRNMHFYSCQYSMFANEAGVCDEVAKEYYVPKGMDDISRVELLEYLMGYCDNGYTEFCKQCGGFWAINTEIINSAEQIIKK